MNHESVEYKDDRHIPMNLAQEDIRFWYGEAVSREPLCSDSFDPGAIHADLIDFCKRHDLRDVGIGIRDNDRSAVWVMCCRDYLPGYPAKVEYILRDFSEHPTLKRMCLHVRDSKHVAVRRDFDIFNQAASRSLSDSECDDLFTRDPNVMMIFDTRAGGTAAVVRYAGFSPHCTLDQGLPVIDRNMVVEGVSKSCAKRCPRCDISMLEHDISKDRDAVRPLRPGTSAELHSMNGDFTFGTIGALLRRPGGPTTYTITCAHVVDMLPDRADVYQPLSYNDDHAGSSIGTVKEGHLIGDWHGEGLDVALIHLHEMDVLDRPVRTHGPVMIECGLGAPKMVQGGHMAPFLSTDDSFTSISRYVDRSGDFVAIARRLIHPRTNRILEYTDDGRLLQSYKDNGTVLTNQWLFLPRSNRVACGESGSFIWEGSDNESDEHVPVRAAAMLHAAFVVNDRRVAVCSSAVSVVSWCRHVLGVDDIDII